MVKHKALVTGGAGFIGTNLSLALVRQGCDVTIFDNMSRVGSRQKAEFLHSTHGVKVVVGDVRTFEDVRRQVEQADVVYHLAAQVAVTTSIDYPRADFDVNAAGTMNVLESARLAPTSPIVLYASTNKVYGDLSDFGIVEDESRYSFADGVAVAEDARIDLKTPYGCSKGAGDLYAQDYARIYGLRTVSFRQSCIYGPHQNGSEDQGWVAHFALSALHGKSVHIFGDGKQVRDLLYVDDLVSAILGAVGNIEKVAGNVYNIGGGNEYSCSVWREFSAVLGRYVELPSAQMMPWRPNDQRVYISDTAKAFADFGWRPATSIDEGVGKMLKWMRGT